MSKKHDDLFMAAQAAINRLFSDQSVPQSQTRSSLEALQAEIDIMLDSLE